MTSKSDARSLKVANQKGPDPGLSELVNRCSGPRSRAWNVTDRATELERQGMDIIHLGVGDPDFDTPREIVEVAVAAMLSGRTHYAAIPGEKELRLQIARNAERQFGRRVDVDRVVIFPGAQCALFSTFLCLAERGDEVILLEPAYATYDAVVEAGGATAVRVPLDSNSGFSLEVERIRNAVTPQTKAILINSPGNPSGAVFEQAAVAELTALCRENGIWLVSDEVYSSMVFEGEYASPFAEADSHDHVIVVNSLSKSHAMTGWRIGWTIAPRSVSDGLANLAQASLFGVSQFSQDAAAFALANDLECVRNMTQIIDQRRLQFCRDLHAIPDIDVYDPAGGMFLLVGIGRLGINGEQFANALLDETGVAVVPGFAFGDSVEDFVRIGYLRDAKVLADAAARIRKFVESRTSG